MFVRFLSSLTAIALMSVIGTAAIAAPSGYHMVFDEEFNGTSLSSSVWSFPATGPNNQHQNSSYLSVGGGFLTLKAGWDGSYVSGSFIKSNQSFTYGYIEVRCQQYLGKGKTVQSGWPAVCTYGANQWTPEYDIAEYGYGSWINGKTQIDQAVHINTNGGANSNYDWSWLYTISRSSWHTFGVDVEPGQGAKFYLDGRLVSTAGASESNVPFVLNILNEYSGGGSSTGVPDFQVDYIQVWQP